MMEKNIERKLIVRNGIPTDWEKIKLIIIENEEMGLSQVANEKRKFEIALNPDFGVIYVLTTESTEESESSELLGFLVIHYRYKSAFITGMAIKNKYRHQGHGQHLFDHLITSLKESPFELLRISSSSRAKTSHQFLLKYGFEICGITSSDLAYGDDHIQFLYRLKPDTRTIEEKPIRLITD